MLYFKELLYKYIYYRIKNFLLKQKPICDFCKSFFTELTLLFTPLVLTMGFQSY